VKKQMTIIYKAFLNINKKKELKEKKKTYPKEKVGKGKSQKEYSQREPLKRYSVLLVIQ